jgi:NAD(P)-dependent dehydrogenase (short-subunit alcohol dehydrogenase family)
MGNPSNHLRSVLVTGATSGIGLAITKELATNGFDIIATARNLNKANLLQTALSEAGLAVRVLACDFENPDEISSLARQVLEIWPQGPWAVVNNAGFAAPGAIEDVTAEIAHRQLAINVLAPAQVVRSFLRQRSNCKYFVSIGPSVFAIHRLVQRQQICTGSSQRRTAN